ncbi:sensor histidine kinase [Streptomyces sp.]|uniref:sensor histidine kinase n=1 Tax=Streptomyces sp. TaxID=1931 RepID=UPI002F93B8E3
MPASSPPHPLIKRLSPGAWAALAWCGGLVVTLLTRLRLPGESEPEHVPGSQLYRWDGPAFLLFGTVLTLAGCALLRRRPLAALGLMLFATVCATTSLSVMGIPMAQYVAVDVALYAIAAAHARRTALVALALALGLLVGYLAFRWLMHWPVGVSAELAVALVAVVAWLLGRSSHQAREHAERARAQAERQAVTAERLRIAREMHDVVAHTIGIVALQAGAAARIVDTRPDRAREAMLAVETAGREALSGLRRMLGALRESDAGEGRVREESGADADGPSGRPAEPGSGPAGGAAARAAGGAASGPGAGAASGPAAGTSSEPASAPALAPHHPDLAPAPGLADLDRLAAATTAAGVRVDVRWQGERRSLPADLDLSAFRIVQESVTNVVRHSGAAACEVLVDFGDGDVRVTVTDRGAAAPGAHSPGFGIAGMRERVALLRGEFEAGPRPEGGFRVSARLPVPQEAL